MAHRIWRGIFIQGGKMKKIILLFFALFFLGCKTTNTITKTSDENAQVSAGKVQVRAEVIDNFCKEYENVLASITEDTKNLSNNIDRMREEYKKLEKDYENLKYFTKTVITIFLNEEEVKYLKEHYPKIYNEIFEEEIK
jgi:thiol-disulfide isomerase/thioredoxin